MREFVLDSVRRALEGEPSVLEAYVFGSTARGDVHPNSDLDVAVFIEPSTQAPTFGHAAAVTSTLMKALGRNDIDVVVLNRAPPLLYQRVLRDGVRVLSRDLKLTTTREGYALSRYFDDLGRQRVVARAMAERAARRESRG